MLAGISVITQFCAPTHFVKPLEKKQQAATFSFGGPVIKFAGAPIPVPFITLGYGYGLTNNVTAYANLNATSLLFRNFQTELGTTIKLYEKEKKIGFSASPALQLAQSFVAGNTFRVWPSLDLNSYFHFKGRASYLYAGVNSWFELSKVKAHNEKVGQHIIPNLNCGYMFVNTLWMHQVQFSYMAIGTPNLPNVADYIGISGKGTFGIYYSLIRKF